MFEWYEEEVRALEHMRAQQMHPVAPVVFYGSSSFRLWQTLADDFPALDLVNCGFGGSTMAACAYYFMRLVPPWQPRALVLYAGDNDLGDGRQPADVIAALMTLLAQAEQTLGTIPLTFVAIKPSPARWHLNNAIWQTNQAARELMDALPNGHYVDVFGPMLGDDGLPRHELYAEDGLHLSAVGYRLWAELLRQQHKTIF